MVQVQVVVNLEVVQDLAVAVMEVGLEVVLGLVVVAGPEVVQGLVVVVMEVGLEV